VYFLLDIEMPIIPDPHGAQVASPATNAGSGAQMLKACHPSSSDIKWKRRFIMANSQSSQGPAKNPAGRFAGQPQDMQPEQEDQSMQSSPSLSRSSDEDAEDGRFSVAEEQSFDQQSDQARHVGQMQGDEGIGLSGVKPTDALAQSAGKNAEGGAPERLEKSMDRAVPKSDDAG
jgi:hypothetical protein